MPTTTIAETATKIDAPLIISLAALVLAILSPLVTAWVQGKYRLKEIKQEAQRDAQRHEQQYYTEHRTEVIENYIRAGMRLSVTESTADIAAFKVASGEIYLYLGKEYWELLGLVDETVETGQYTDIRFLMLDLSKKLVENNDMPRQPISSTPKAPDK